MDTFACEALPKTSSFFRKNSNLDCVRRRHPVHMIDYSVLFVLPGVSLTGLRRRGPRTSTSRHSKMESLAATSGDRKLVYRVLSHIFRVLQCFPKDLLTVDMSVIVGVVHCRRSLRYPDCQLGSP